MRHQSIEETFRAIKPRHHGVPEAAPISAGFTSAGGTFSDSLSQAAQEIAQLRASYQAQADLIAANTTALERHSSSSNGQSPGGSVAGTVKSIAENALGGGLLGIIPLISGIANLFGGGGSAPPPLPSYAAPPSIQLDTTIRNTLAPASDPVVSAQSPQGLTNLLADGLRGSTAATGPSTMGSSASQPERPGGALNNQTAFTPQVIVNIHAMDSQSFLDRSSDIASAVREAVLNLHPLNKVLAEL